MSRRMVSILGAAAALFAVSAVPASASAIAEPAPLPYCYGATYGGNTVQICAAENIGIGNGTVDPGLSTDCIIRLPILDASTNIAAPPVVASPCRLVGNVVTGIDSTGFTPSGDPLYGPTIVGLSVRFRGYSVGTLYVDGATTPVDIESTCVGGGCPTSLDALINLVGEITA